MAGEALFVGWGQIVRGREKRGLGVFQESVEYYGKLQQEGRIEKFDLFLLAPHGGDLAGFAILQGEPAKLSEIRFSDDFERLITRAGSVVDNVGVVIASTGEKLAKQMGLFAQVADELGG
jgi:hypothetical protein